MIKLQAPSQIITKDECFDVVREGPVKWVDGKPVKETAATFKIHANVQPLNGRDLLLVPEADRFKEQYTVFTNDPIKVNDRVVRLGVSFQVQTVETWGSFSEARMMRVDVGPNASP